MDKKSSTEAKPTTIELAEERVREIVREEIEAWCREGARKNREALERMIKSGAYSF